MKWVVSFSRPRCSAQATLAQKERDARGRVEREERKLMQKDLTLKRRLARRVKEAAAIVQAHRAECDVRDRRLRVREEEIRRRNTDLVYLLRRARKYEASAKRTQQRLDPATVDVDDAPWEQRPQTAPLRRSVTPEINPELDDLELRATQGLETYGADSAQKMNLNLIWWRRWRRRDVTPPRRRRRGHARVYASRECTETLS